MRASLVSLAIVAFSLASAIPTPEDSRSRENMPQEQSHPQPPQQQQTMHPDYSGGEAIYYLQQRQYGSCQEVHEDTDLVVAISYQLQGFALPPLQCGRKVEITNRSGGKDSPDQGKKVTATVVDTCSACEIADMELSVGAFQALKGGELDPASSLTIDWRFL